LWFCRAKESHKTATKKLPMNLTLIKKGKYMKFILIIISIFILSGCMTRALWEQTIEETHDVVGREKLTDAQFKKYSEMAETNKMIQVDPITNSVYIHKNRSKRMAEFGATCVVTPFLLLIDIPLWVLFSDVGEKNK
jgi:hypothetical protein